MFELLEPLTRPSDNLMAGAFKPSKSDKRSVFEVTERNNINNKRKKIIKAT